MATLLQFGLTVSSFSLVSTVLQYRFAKKEKLYNLTRKIMLILTGHFLKSLGNHVEIVRLCMQTNETHVDTRK
jgi:hypothetical protein